MHRKIRSLIDQSLSNLADETHASEYTEDDIQRYLLQVEPINPIGCSFRYVFDHARGKFAYLSEEVEKITGFNRMEFLNSKFSEMWNQILSLDHGIVLSELSSRCFERLRRAYQDRYDIWVFMDYSILRKDGGRRRILASIKPLYWNKYGALELAGGYFTDISHLKMDGQPGVTIHCNGDVLEKFEPDARVVKEAIPDFTRRELEILLLFAKGASMEDVVRSTGLSKYTVYTHRRNILAKTELPSIPDVIRYLQASGLVT